MNETEIFQHYQVLRREDGSLWELGRGAMGVTYKAFDTDLHCDVALKIILPTILNNEGARERFLREARSAARLRHPNIAAIFYLGQTTDETYFYAMEFCEGETLQQTVEKRGPLDPSFALTLVRQISRALVLANEHQLVHRDIKPSNLILTEPPGEEPTVKIIDFGLAKSYATEASTWASMGTNGFIGTAHFASPEQLENEPVDGRSDIYSLGGTFWYMLTGKSMFGGSIARIVSQHLSAPVPWSQLEGLNVPPAVRALIARMVEKIPADRFQNASELKRAVDDCLAVMAGGVEAGTVRMPAGEPGEISGSEEAPLVLGERWQLGEECGGRQTGPLYRATDLQQGGQPVAVKVLDARLAADAEICGQVERTLQILSTAPHENLIQPLVFGDDGVGGRFLVMEWMEGFTLLAVLRARGALTLRETLGLLKPMAAGFDHARQHGLTRLELSKHQGLVHFPGGFEDEQQREQILHLPLAEWPPFKVALGTLPLERPSADGDETLVDMQTRGPSPVKRDMREAGGLPTPPALEISGLGHLIYELLGGTPTTVQPEALQTGARYIPLAGLTEMGNTVLRRAVLPAGGDPGFLTAQNFYEALAGTVDTERVQPTTTRPLPPVPVAVEAIVGNRERAPSERRWVWLAVPALLAVAGLMAHFGLDRSSPPATASKNIPAPVTASRDTPPTASAPPEPPATTTLLPPPDAPMPPPSPNLVETPPPEIPVATPAVVAVTPAPLPPLAGTLERVEHSPRGDLRVEYRRSDAETSIWLIPKADDARRQLLYKSPRDANVLFSPDEKWLLIHNQSASSGGGTQLYRRPRDDSPYEVPANMECFHAPIGDLAWRFYLGKAGLPPDTDRKQISIDGVRWQPDSSSFVLRVVSAGPGGMDTVPAAWLCRYDLATQRFQAITDPHQARDAIAARSQEKIRAAATPLPVTPPAVARPPVPWQDTLGNFVNAFVRNDQTHDVDAAIANYASTVDYFGEGRVSQAYIRHDITQFNQRWPKQRDSIIGNVDLREITPGQSYSARFHMAFYVESAERRGWVRGEFALEMTIAVMNGTPRIVSIRENVVHREKGKLSKG